MPESKTHANTKITKQPEMTSTTASPSSVVIADVLANAKSLYEVLGDGVDQSSSPEQLAKARRQRQLALHPDRIQETADSKRALQLVEDAYTQLSDERKRGLYDMSQAMSAGGAAAIAMQQSLHAMHVSLVTTAIFSNAASKSSSATSAAAAAAPMPVRKCSCGMALSKPDDLLCSGCSSYKKVGRCKSMGCLNDLTPVAAGVNAPPPTDAAKDMCLKCAQRRKCVTWGCMKKVECNTRDVCLSHHQQQS